MAKCIYCNSSDVSESDIIPVSLTNAKITKSNVCRVKHNNEFGETFESDVINKLTFLRDQLDITTKNKKYPETTVNVKIDDIILKKNMTKNSNIFGENLISSIDNKSKVGPIDKINKLAGSAKIKGNQVGTVTEIDINEKVIETQFHIDLKAFISDSSKRLAAKMAYEWFCYVYNIEENLEEFKEIVDFICDTSSNSNNKDIVTYVSDNRVYEFFKQHTSHGSHTFMAYEGNESINVLISFFGVCVYNVRLLNKLIPKYKKNCFLHEFQLSAKRSILNQQSINEFYQLIDKGLEVVETANGPALAPKEEYKTGYNWGAIGLYYNIQLIINKIEFLTEENEALVNQVIKKLVEVMNANILHLRNLKRFVKDCIVNNDNLQLNPYAFGGEKIFFYYVVYKIGLAEDSVVNEQSIKQVLSGLVDENVEVNLSFEKQSELWNELLTDGNYSEILKKGGQKISDAQL